MQSSGSIDARPKSGASGSADCYAETYYVKGKKRVHHLCEAYASDGYWSNYFSSCQIRTTVLLSQGLKSDKSFRVKSCN